MADANEVSDSSYSKGMVGLGVVGYALAQFDNFKVESLKPAPPPRAACGAVAAGVCV